ncbi:helix-turn-helix domain-containing protein [Cupriavidus pinatubonensis]|uniref:helix-turn-helix domain-containing protein n=1 Tax=Cupriavidus pinatubonensis TaxID=248026 RepID=UPI003618BF16
MTAAEYLHQIHETRRRRLQSLVDTFQSMREAAQEIGCYSASHLSRLCSGKQAFNEEIARRIEDGFGLEFGALDRALEG